MENNEPTQLQKAVEDWVTRLRQLETHSAEFADSIGKLGSAWKGPAADAQAALVPLWEWTSDAAGNAERIQVRYLEQYEAAMADVYHALPEFYLAPVAATDVAEPVPSVGPGVGYQPRGAGYSPGGSTSSDTAGGTTNIPETSISIPDGRPAHTEDRQALARLTAMPRRRGGQLVANGGGLRGRRRSPVLSWFDTDGGRYFARHRDAWFTIAPADPVTLGKRLQEMVFEVTAQNRNHLRT